MEFHYIFFYLLPVDHPLSERFSSTATFLFIPLSIPVLVSTFLINHCDLFGLRQVWLNLRKIPYTPLKFETPLIYRIVRHPLYLGWLLAFWCTPTMTIAHLVFAMATTAYILLAIQWEERDLMNAHPEYRAYRKQVPMIIPFSARQGVDDEFCHGMGTKV